MHDINNGLVCEKKKEIHTKGHIGRLYFAVFILVVTLFLPDNIKPFGYVLSYIIAGYHVLKNSIKNIFSKDFFDENFLMTIATIGAICIKEYPEAVMVMILYLLGDHFQDKAVDKTRKSITKLMDFRPEYANVEENGIIEICSPENVKINAIIVIKPGEKVPLDGVIIEGESLVDKSSLTGESIPVRVKEGDEILSGTVNTTGVIKVKVTKAFKDSTVSKILELVEYSANKKSKTENFISKFAKIYTPIVVFLAVCIIIIPYFMYGIEDIKIWILRALTFLVISCPCAFVISVPLTFYAGIGCASRHGILVKGGNYLEMLSKVSTAAFDKTGTLTTGQFKVKEVIPSQGFSREELLKIAAQTESFSNHPIAKAVVSAYDDYIDTACVGEFSEISGLGIKAKLNSEEIIIGNKEMMKKFGLYISENNHCTLYVAKNGQYIGQIVISDTIKNNAKSAINKLKELVPNIVMLTGDSSENAQMIANEIGIDEYYSKLLPADKIEKIETLISNKRKGSSVIFTGDGVNDAPVLMRADVGIAMGALGSDSAIEAADVVIADDNIDKIPLAVKIAKHTIKIAKENIAFAISVKLLFLILGALGLMTMWGAVFADVGVTLIAVLNSIRTLRLKN